MTGIVRTIPEPQLDVQRRIAVVTGSRADFGLLRPVIDAIAAHPRLDLELLATGTHLIGDDPTIKPLRTLYPDVQTIKMQQPGHHGRLDDARALGRGITAIADWLDEHPVDVLLVLGDRIEAFAGASAAAIGGVRLAHIHGGDRAEGVADESMRHAITKLAHLHLPATPRSTERILAMGEASLRTHLVGSPAVDGLDDILPLDDDSYADLGRPEIVILLHPTDDSPSLEHDRARMLLERARAAGSVLVLEPNHDPGRNSIMEAIGEFPNLNARAHLPRQTFVGLLRRVRFLAGNSSAGLIECAPLRVRCVNIGSRQAGREKPPNVINCPDWQEETIARAMDRALIEPVLPFRHPYGDGRTGVRIAEVLATFDSDKHLLAKRNTY